MYYSVEEYPSVRDSSPKLESIAEILNDKKPRGAKVLIMSAFTEMILIVERVSLSLIRDPN